ncbi:MFS transporter [Reyranella sp.]|uniref:MFS transporter n=1 Tax=Reyranella sp. TaxID=1929291 RepID=UPI003D0AF264
MSVTPPGRGVDSAYAWRLAWVSMACVALGGGGIYLPMVGLKEMAADFGDQRAVPSFAYMVGFFGMGVGGVFMGWLADRTSPRVPLLIAGVCIALGGWVASRGGEIALYAGYAVLLGFLGNAGTFTPAMNNVQGWFEKRRNMAIALISIGPAVAGSVWPQVYRLLLPEIGWRDTLLVYGLSAGGLLLLGALYVRAAPTLRGPGGRRREEKVHLPLPSSTIMLLLSAAGFCCCAAMAIPFVHMVAFCGDLGYPAARGTEAVSLVLVSAIVATFVMARLAQRIGPLPVSLLCSVIQIGSLVGFLYVRNINGIYALSLLHGIPFIAIVQGYALNLRFLYGPTIAGWRLGVVMLFAMAGMAAGGWLGGFIFDATLSYTSAFQSALAFNLLNLMLLGILYTAQRRRHMVSLP